MTPTGSLAHRPGQLDYSKSYTSEMLENASLVAFIPVSGITVARAFYATTLGFTVLEESPFALVISANGTKIRLSPVPDLHPQPFTIAGWEVADIDATISELDARGVTFKRFEGMDQRANGVWQSPSGDFVAWFADLDDNILSLTEYAVLEST
jgi:hypothetical protein